MDVIEFKENSNKELIAFENSFALSNQQNSRSQAQIWVEKIPLNIKRIAIVGMGSGFHIEAAVKSGRFDSIDAIDCRAPLVGGFFRRFKLDREILSVHQIETEEALIESELFQKVISEKIPVYYFSECFANHDKQLFRFVQILTGRSKKSLEKVLASLGMKLEIEEKIDQSQHWLSIKDLGVVVDAKNIGHPSATAIRILRELVS